MSTNLVVASVSATCLASLALAQLATADVLGLMLTGQLAAFFVALWAVAAAGSFVAGLAGYQTSAGTWVVAICVLYAAFAMWAKRRCPRGCRNVFAGPDRDTPSRRAA